MKKFYVILCLFMSSAAFAQAPLLVEDFNYTAGDLLTAHGWLAHSGGTTAPILVTTPGLAFAGYVGSSIGNAAGLNNTGQDVNMLFTEQTSGSIYASFLVNSTATSTNATVSNVFFHFFDPNANTSFRARTFIINNTGKMQIGFSFNASTPVGLSSTLLDFGTTYLVVVKYTIVTGIENDIVSLYVFKTGDDFSIEPTTPFLGPLTATNTTLGDITTPLGPDIRPYGIALRQFDAAQRITVDGFRVKTSWSLAQDASAAALSVSATTLTIAAAASSTKSFDITSNTSWTAASDQTWLTVGTLSGTGNATVTLTATENLTATTRVATVTVSGTGLAAQTITVTQDAASANTLTVSATTLTIAAAASSTKTFDITSNTSWTAASNQTWLTVGTLTGTGNATVTLTATANPTTATRAATVTVSATGVTTQTITVTQDGATATLTVSATTLTIAAAASSTKTFDISSNTSWTAASNQTWLTVGTLTGTGNATVTLTAAVNPTTATRAATVTVSATGATAQTITVTQDGSTTGIGEISNKQVAIYPNPVINGILNISSSNNSIKQIDIFDTIGKMIWSEQTSINNIDVSGLNAGIYIIKVREGNNTSTSKFIIK